jgi:hypothetical protein
LASISSLLANNNHPQLFQFLHDKNPQARQIALENLLPHTPKDATHRTIFFDGLQSSAGLQKAKENTVIRDLKILCRDNLVSMLFASPVFHSSCRNAQAVAHDAFRALVNLSDSAMIHPHLIEPPFFIFLVSYIVVSPSLNYFYLDRSLQFAAPASNPR